jgi:hypothetical protein
MYVAPHKTSARLSLSLLPRTFGAASETNGNVQTCSFKPPPSLPRRAQTTDPLGEATKFLTPLVKHAADDVMTHVYAAKIYVRRRMSRATVWAGDERL